MTADEQLVLWLEGDSRCPNDRDECCPDFSCCRPDFLADKKTRQAFVDGDEKTRMELLGMFLGNAFAVASENKVYIAGVDDPEKTVM